MGIFFIGPYCLNPSVKLFRSDRTIIYNKVVIKTIFPNFFMPLTIFGTPVQYLCIVKTIRETATRCKSSMRSCRTSAWRRKRHGAYRHLDDGDTRADGALSKLACQGHYHVLHALCPLLPLPLFSCRRVAYEQLHHCGACGVRPRASNERDKQIIEHTYTLIDCNDVHIKEILRKDIGICHSPPSGIGPALYLLWSADRPASMAKDARAILIVN